MSQQPVAHPKSVLRGHRAQVYVTAFIRGNDRLASGDADGFVVLWDLTIMRPRAVWRAHTNAILSIAGWGHEQLITQGRDNRLIVWKIAVNDEAALSKALPLDDSAPERPQPWILHILEINTMNFCSFGMCSAKSDTDSATSDELLVAVPNAITSEFIDIFHFPSQQRRFVVSLEQLQNKGMAMAVSMFWLTDHLYIAAGYENGMSAVFRRSYGDSWEFLYKSQSHSQPILSLDVGPNKDYFLTSSADAIIAKHPIPNPPLTVNGTDEPIKTINTKHSGQQDLTIRSDGRIFATAGWDSKIRVYSAKTLAELAVLKWHSVGCYAVSFAELNSAQNSGSKSPQDDTSTAISDLKKSDTSDASKGAITNVSSLGELSVKDKRLQRAKEAHWLAAGSKDGKISLWDIY